MLFTDSLKIDLLGLLIAVIVILISWNKWIMGHWKRKGVPGPEPTILFGNLKNFFLGKNLAGQSMRDIYLEAKAKDHRYIGIYFGIRPNFVPLDQDLIKRMLQTDFEYFNGRGFYHNEEVDPLNANVLTWDGDKWKNIRRKINPTFSPGKLKMLHHILENNGRILAEVLEKIHKDGPVEMKDIFSRYTTDNITSCAFGLDVSSLRDPNAEFKKMGDRIVELTFTNIVRSMATLFVPHSILRAIRFAGSPPDIVEFFTNTVTSTIKYREENNIVRPDFMNLLIEMKNSPTKEGRLTLNEIIGQCFIFFFGGFETSATTASFASFHLAEDQEVQDKAREEINRVLAKHDDKLTFEAVQEMEYVEQIVQETLRIRTPAPMILRKCTKNWQIPGESTIIEEGTNVIISALGIHNDPEYYPNPEKFDPDRFSTENKNLRPHHTWLPFGEGPRICLGARFGMHQTKLGLVQLIRNYKITLNSKTEVPLVYDSKSIIPTPRSGIWMDLHKI